MKKQLLPYTATTLFFSALSLVPCFGIIFAIISIFYIMNAKKEYDPEKHLGIRFFNTAGVLTIIGFSYQFLMILLIMVFAK